jgi:glutaminyl-peptide cyclotransferase
MKKTKKKYIFVIGIISVVAAIGLAYWPGHLGSTDGIENIDELEKMAPTGPEFNADSAFTFTQAQCDFGPRAMNTDGHEKCLDWIVAKFRQYGCKVELQKADLKGYDGTILKATNIMASHNPEATMRIMLCAHWDSRPWADNDPDSANWRKPILAANDAASGVAVMLELARLLSADSTVQENGEKLSIGVDFVCFDAEDWGVPQWADVQDDGNSWALGSNYFASNLPQGYAPRYGILLDMVGGQGARFHQEALSKQYAPDIVKKVWRAARQAGYGSYFPKTEGGMITDDHVPLNQIAKIPCIDIIPFYPDCVQSSFGPTWHTLDDNMDHIDKNTLKAVGQTMIQVIYTEK